MGEPGSGGADGEETRPSDQRRVWPMFADNSMGTAFALLPRKHTVVHDKEEKGGWPGKAITKPSDVRDPRQCHLKCDF